jgi:hypothetical protein
MPLTTPEKPDPENPDPEWSNGCSPVVPVSVSAQMARVLTAWPPVTATVTAAENDAAHDSGPVSDHVNDTTGASTDSCGTGGPVGEGEALASADADGDWVGGERVWSFLPPSPWSGPEPLPDPACGCGDADG